MGRWSQVSRLADTIGRLHEHFENLRDARDAAGSVVPVFGLEHPLDQADLNDLAKDLSNSLNSGYQVEPAHALGWVVIASETGYGFGGCEFWQSFNDRIPNWTDLGDREALRTAFTIFSARYRGARPTGQWASHYTLICWPIAHAILPRDLQARLCETIYGCRHQLAALSDASAEATGLAIARATPSCGTRFDEFLQEHALVGAIVNRLLRGESETTSSFRSETFDRILSDLHRLSAAREWLSEARQIYNHRLTISAPHGPPVNATKPTSPARTQPFDLRPTLLLEADESGTWRPSIVPPSLISWGQEDAELRSLIESLRYRVIGTDRARQGASLLASNPIQAILEALPPLDTPLIEIMPHSSRLSAAFDADCRLPSSCVLIFHERDAIATLSQRSEVRPGETYLIATQDVTIELGAPVPCVDPTWQLRRVQLPSPLTAILSNQLSLAGIHVKRSTRLRPWGLLPRKWDDNNDGEWLVTEPIVYTIERDHAFDEVSFCIDDNPPTFIECGAMADPTIVITDLSAGSHSLMVQTYERRSGKSGSSLYGLSHGEAHIRVREPSSWTPGRMTANTLSIVVEPPRPSLEELLKGQVSLTVEGIASGPVEVSIQWRDGSSAAFSRINVLRQRAPIRADAWSASLAVLLKKIDDSTISLGALQAQIQIECEPLGKQIIPINVTASSVRWSARDKMVRLICDGSHSPRVVAFAFAEPATAMDVDRRTCERGLDANRSGLYVAMDGDICRGVVLGSPRDDAGGLRAIGEAIHLGHLRLCETNDLKTAIDRWESATPINVYARTNQQRVVTLLHSEVLRRLTGDHWVKLERLNPLPWPALEEAVDHPLPIHSFGYSLGRHRGRSENPDALRRTFFQVATAFTSVRDEAQLEMAWLFATEASVALLKTTVMQNQDELSRLVRGARLIWLGNHTPSVQ